MPRQKTNTYHCKHCGKTLRRQSSKAWIKSFCISSGKTVHAKLVTKR